MRQHTYVNTECDHEILIATIFIPILSRYIFVIPTLLLKRSSGLTRTTASEVCVRIFVRKSVNQLLSARINW